MRKQGVNSLKELLGAGFKLHGKFYWPWFTDPVKFIVFQGRTRLLPNKQTQDKPGNFINGAWEGYILSTLYPL